MGGEEVTPWPHAGGGGGKRRGEDGGGLELSGGTNSEVGWKANTRKKRLREPIPEFREKWAGRANPRSGVGRANPSVGAGRTNPRSEV